MSSPPPNPDTRPLPPGWVQQYDWNYKTWFYVDTSVNPPRSSWTHPGAVNSFVPPAGPPPGPPPPDNRSYNSSPYPPQGGYNQGPPPGQQSWGGPGYGGPGPGYSPGPGYGQGPPPEQRGWFGGGSPQPPPQVVYQQAAPPRKSGMGMGTVALAAGGGLLGGMLLEDAIDDHDENIERESYDDGYQDGQNDDFGGGDW